jgi:hypothetical protein
MADMESLMHSGPRTRPLRMVREPRLSPVQRGAAGAILVICGAAIIHAGSQFIAQLPIFQIQPQTIQFESALPEPMMDEARVRLMAALPAGQSLVGTQVSQLENALKSDPRMADIQVRLRFPNRVLVSAVERVPEALITLGSSLVFVDGLGNVLRPATPAQIAAANRPFLTGLAHGSVHPGQSVESPMAAMGLQFLAYLRDRHPEFHQRISAIHVGRDQVSHLESLTVHLDAGTEIIMGATDPVALIPDMLAVVRKLESEGTRMQDLAYIDLTGKDRAATLDRVAALAAALGVDVESIMGLSRVARPTSTGTASLSTPQIGQPAPVTARPSGPVRSAYDASARSSERADSSISSPRR